MVGNQNYSRCWGRSYVEISEAHERSSKLSANNFINESVIVIRLEDLVLWSATMFCPYSHKASLSIGAIKIQVIETYCFAICHLYRK